MSYCENCGKEVSKKAKYCGNCGERLSYSIDNDIQVVNEESNQPQGTAKKTHVKRYILLAIVLAIAFFTKPNLYDHKDTIVEEILVPLVDSVGKNLGVDDLSSTRLFGIDLTRTGFKTWLNKPDVIKYNDYLILSTTESEGQTISYGIFGLVFIPPQVKREIKELVTGNLNQ